MTEMLGKPGRLRESSCRVAVLVVVISCHLGLLLMLLRPVILYRNTKPAARINPRVLKLRFFHPLQPALPRSASPLQRPIAPSAHGSTKVLEKSPKSPKSLVILRASQVDAQSYQTRLAGAPGPDVGDEKSPRDGGFRERLQSAQHSNSVGGVPGSDTSFAPGIHLVDPMSQGIGAVMRTTQRAFGITNSHCVDVDVWRHLSQKKLIARHISQRDVDKVDEKYACNKPLGLRF